MEWSTPTFDIATRSLPSNFWTNELHVGFGHTTTMLCSPELSGWMGVEPWALMTWDQPASQGSRIYLVLVRDNLSWQVGCIHVLRRFSTWKLFQFVKITNDSNMIDRFSSKIVLESKSSIFKKFLRFVMYIRLFWTSL